MKHRERVQLALNHETPDRCPMQISFTPEFAARLRADLNLEGQGHNPHGGGNTYVLERALDQDLLLTSVGWANSYYAGETYGAGDSDTYVDEWGITWRNVAYETRFGTGHYTEMVGHPLADDDALDTYRALDAYQPPDPNRPELYVEAENTIRQYKDEYWIVGVTVTTIWETAWALRGYERALTDLLFHPDLVERLFDIPFRYHLAAASRLVELGVDMIWIGDDMGMQRGMLISVETWRRFFKPRLATFIATLKGLNPEVKVAYHSDGAIWPIIPDLIEIGLEVLNPIQPECMDPAKLKELYGDQIAFWGTIGTQTTMPFGSPQDVRAAVEERIKTVGVGGGLLIGPTHQLEPEVPLDNVFAFVEAVHELGGYA